MAAAKVCLMLLALLSALTTASDTTSTSTSSTINNSTDNINSRSSNNCTARASTRRKRMIWMSSDRRLTLPPETLLILTPTLSLPFGRNLPIGYGSSMTISVPFKIVFDDLGLTSEENPFGIFPDFFFNRRKRDADLPGINWAGGDREMMFQIVEDSLHNLGMDGQACLLRAICEVFQAPLLNHGFVGEVLELFLSVSRAPYAERRLVQYLAAEQRGRLSGNCSEYHQMCPFSLFTSPKPARTSRRDYKKPQPPSPPPPSPSSPTTDTNTYTHKQEGTPGAAAAAGARKGAGKGMKEEAPDVARRPLYPEVTRIKKQRKRCYQQHT